MSEQEKDWSDANWLRMLFNPPTNYGYRFDAKAVERAFRIAQQLEDDDELRQQLAASQAREAELAAWKESAIAVTPPLQEIARELDMPLGASIHDKILPGVKLLKLQLNVLRECVGLYADRRNWRTVGGNCRRWWEYLQHGCEPALAALAKVEEMK